MRAPLSSLSACGALTDNMHKKVTPVSGPQPVTTHRKSFQRANTVIADCICFRLILPFFLFAHLPIIFQKSNKFYNEHCRHFRTVMGRLVSHLSESTASTPSTRARRSTTRRMDRPQSGQFSRDATHLKRSSFHLNFCKWLLLKYDDGGVKGRKSCERILSKTKTRKDQNTFFN